MDSRSELAAMFKALGDPTRLRIFEFLRASCGTCALGDQGQVHDVSGPTVGQVCCHITGLEKVSSTISFHLKELRLAGLIQVEKRGKYLMCRVDPDAVSRLEAFLRGEGESCC